MFRNQELEEYETIQREEALKKIAALVKRYQFTHSDLLSIVPTPVGHEMGEGEALPERKFDPFFDAW